MKKNIKINNLSISQTVADQSKNTSKIKKPVTNTLDDSGLDKLYEKVKSVIEKTREKVFKTINFETVKGYWEIGRYIVEDEQHGEKRASKGDALIKKLAEKLTNEYGSGFDYSNVKHMKNFYINFPKGDALSDQISWTHYRTLLKVDNEKARIFYINESIKGRWGTRTLERAILTKLYERTLLAQKDTQTVNDLVEEVKTNEAEAEYTPEYFIKDPYNLSFTGIKANSKFYEKNLEQALMDKLQDFILELGRGFAFVSRQYRINIEEDNYYVDLVFYNYILKCFLLIDLKTTKLNHQDIGQMDFYVRYFEKEVRQNNDNPTIGLILCADKNNKLVKYTLLDESKNIFASQYQLYLPSVEVLEKELIEEKERIEQEQRLNKDIVKNNKKNK